MRRRQVLTGLAAGVPLITGCTTLLGGGESEDKDKNGDESQSGTVGSNDGTSTGGTEQQTARSTATSASTPTATAQPTDGMMGPTMTRAQPTDGMTGPTMTRAQPTDGLTGPTTGTNADLSKLEKYTNRQYSYTIKYPAGWTASDSDPSTVSFSGTGSGSLSVRVIANVPTSLDRFTKNFKKGYRRSAGQDGSSVELKSQRLNLSNGHSAILIDAQAIYQRVKVQQTILLTIVNGTAYTAALTITNPNPSMKKNMKKIVTSLTIN